MKEPGEGSTKLRATYKCDPASTRQLLHEFLCTKMHRGFFYSLNVRGADERSLEAWYLATKARQGEPYDSLVTSRRGWLADTHSQDPCARYTARAPRSLGADGFAI